MAAEPLSISVALCTFNGDRFLSEQLRSIGSQSRLPSELVLCDDGSTDGTLDIVRQFARDAPFPVHVVVNPENLGSTKNFEKAISLCQGDVIALSDQDDIWEPTKLAEIGRALEGSSNVAMVFTDADVVGDDGHPLGYSLWTSRAIPVTPKQSAMISAGGLFSILLKYNIVTGATMAFRSSLRSFLLPIPAGWVHDAWLALLISARWDVGSLPMRLVRYRQHGGQQIGGRWLSFRQQVRWASSIGRPSFEQVIRNIDAAIARLESQADPGATIAVRRLLDKRRHFEARLLMRTRGGYRWKLAAREFVWGRYALYDLGWKSLAQDLFLTKGETQPPEKVPPLWGARVVLPKRNDETSVSSDDQRG